ncbi:Bee-milk protein [Caenorhabditis elegans]|uniref:Bee-milk protein n=1 Tax=Caenorhabditis elegans TaxID=6239 RepID=Q95XB1_CAEEL|nr:Bee-milk protein [Caenorhabditis elegans]CCD73888.1 Bee-milk protein [Caenorhabditis elegans]|eukprot:NP_497393.1 Uncharacterized protein CELE_Y82E9BL.1 [Caenorhabditis elegans]
MIAFNSSFDLIYSFQQHPHEYIYTLAYYLIPLSIISISSSMRALLLFLPVFANACLKINQLAPPPCACNVLAIDPADVYNYEPQVSNFWANKPQSLLRKPIQIVDDCSVKMYCDGEAKLFIFDF